MGIYQDRKFQIQDFITKEIDLKAVLNLETISKSQAKKGQNSKNGKDFSKAADEPNSTINNTKLDLLQNLSKSETLTLKIQENVQAVLGKYIGDQQPLLI